MKVERTHWTDEDGNRHREDGPAYIHSSGYKAWWIHGKRHREDGPACIWENGAIEWHVNNIEITKEVIIWMEDYSVEPDYTKWTDKEKMWFRLRFC